MKTLADWYPGDEMTFACLEALGMIVLVVAAALIAEQLLARKRAAVRSGLWQAALIGVLVTPALASWGSRLPWHVAIFSAVKTLADQTAAPAPEADRVPPPPSARAVGVTVEAGPPPSSGMRLPHAEVPATSRAVLDVVPAEEPRSESAPQAPPKFAAKATAIDDGPAAMPPNLFHALATGGFMVWGLGSIFLLARTAHGWWAVRRLGRCLLPLEGEHWAAELKAAACTLSVANLPHISLSPDVRGPAVIGLLAPRVVLPESLLARCTAQQFCEILVHECAHIVRRDPWMRLLQSLAAVFFWVNPLVALLNRRLSQAREEVCDNYVLAQTEPVGYADTLLAVARICYPNPRLEGFLTMIPHHHNLERRVADLLEENRDRSTRLGGRQRACAFNRDSPWCFWPWVPSACTVGRMPKTRTPKLLRQRRRRRPSPTSSPPWKRLNRPAGKRSRVWSTPRTGRRLSARWCGRRCSTIAFWSGRRPSLARKVGSRSAFLLAFGTFGHGAAPKEPTVGRGRRASRSKRAGRWNR